MGIRLKLFWCLCLVPSFADAQLLDLPVRLEEGFLQKMLIEQVFTEQGDEARVWYDRNNCNFLTLSSPELKLVNTVIRTRTRARVKIGTPLGNSCIPIFNWNGFIEVEQQPVLMSSKDLVEFRIVDSRIYARSDIKINIAGTLWRWCKNYVHPRFDRLRLDLSPLIADLSALLQLVFPSDTPGIDRLLESVRISRAGIDKQRIELGIRLDVPGQVIMAEQIPDTEPEPALTPEELRRWEAWWQQWDAFLTRVIKHAGAGTQLHAVHSSLLAVLLDARQDILEILNPKTSNDPNPVPGLFVTTWNQLAPELRRVSATLPSSSALSYLSFITAGDVLLAIQATGKHTGLNLDEAALRRMVRMLISTDAGDPLFYEVTVDPDLRSLFGFGEPIPLPGSSSSATIRLTGGMHVAGMFFMPVTIIPSHDYQKLVERLNGWVPTRQILADYLPAVHQLLEWVTESKLIEKKLEVEYHDLFKSLVLSTAWQESCWRQFIKEKGEIKPIGSHAGAVGIMQINQHVWRGFYDVDSLKEDVGYNARAGSEILYHYLVDYAITKGEHERAGGLENLPRATYAMYNGGPRQMTRYRDDRTSKSLHLIDDAFWNKYLIVSTGNIMGVAECFSG